MRHEILRTRDEWSKLRHEWNELLCKSRAKSLFLTWQWLDTWLQVRKQEPELLVVCVRGARGELLGLAPYYKTDYKLVRFVPYRVLRMVGDVESGAEYQTWLAEQTNESDVFAEIAKALWALRAEWDLIWMPQLGTWATPPAPIIGALRASRLLVNRRPNLFSAVALPNDYESYLGEISSNRRQQIRRMSRKILSRPNVEIRKLSSPDEVGPALEALFRLHEKRWRALGQPGVFTRNPMERAFYEQFVPKAFEQGWLAMYTLFDNGVPKATQIGYVYDNGFLQLQEGFDPDYAAHAGNVLRRFVIEDCIKSGIREYDFLGGVSEHKRRWLAKERTGMDLLISAPRLKNIPIMKAGVWPTGAYLRPQDRRYAASADGDVQVCVS